MSEYELPPSIRPATDPIRLKGGHTTRDPRLDRLVEFDERSRQYPARQLLRATEQKPRSYTWSCGTRHDQGQVGACVGHAWAHEASARPVVVPTVSEDAFAVYHRAQQLDTWAGEGYEGTSVLAGAQAAVERGWFDSYYWILGGASELALVVGHKGPVVLGIPWFTSMFETDAKGFISVDGEVAGGHAILVNRVDVPRRCFGLVNSWGDWGIRDRYGLPGTCLVTFDDMDRLLALDGEACLAVGRKRA